MSGGACPVRLNFLLPNAACSANLGRCPIRVGWGPPGGLWAYPKYWASIRCWGDHCLGCILNDESQVSQSASAQVGVDCPRVYCWKYREREACNDVLDGGVLHLDVLGVPECLCALLIQKRFGPGYQINASVVLGLNPWVLMF
jgi:hypothetical protein